MTEAETIDLLVLMLAEREPFVHVRFGDGDIMFMSGTGSVVTGDGEEWSPVLQRKLLVAWGQIAHANTHLLLGDLETYAVSDGCEAEWRKLIDAWDLIPRVHMEALRVGFGHALPAYQAIREYEGFKAFIGPKRLAPVAVRLGCEWHFEVPLSTAHEDAITVATAVIDEQPELALFAAGRGGKIMQGHIAEKVPEISQIDVGSGLDLLIDDGVRRGTDLGVDREAILRVYREARIAP